MRKTIIDTCYAEKIAHNKYLPQFSSTTTTTTIHLQSYFHYYLFDICFVNILFVNYWNNN
jgi:hypothetical protein